MADAAEDTTPEEELRPYVDLSSLTRREAQRMEKTLGRAPLLLVQEWNAGQGSLELMELVVRTGRLRLDGEMREALRLDDDPTMDEVISRFNLVRFGWGPDEVDPPGGGTN